MPPPHLRPSNDPAPMSTREMFGLSLQMPEPEVVRSTLARTGCKALARIIADLINENERLLEATCEGATVTVRERGGSSAMTFTVKA